MFRTKIVHTSETLFEMFRKHVGNYFKTMFPYIVKFNNSIKRNIIYLKEDESYFDFLYQIYPSFKRPTSLYQNSEDEHKKLSKIEEDFVFVFGINWNEVLIRPLETMGLR